MSENWLWLSRKSSTVMRGIFGEIRPEKGICFIKETNLLLEIVFQGGEKEIRSVFNSNAILNKLSNCFSLLSGFNRGGNIASFASKFFGYFTTTFLFHPSTEYFIESIPPSSNFTGDSIIFFRNPIKCASFSHKSIRWFSHWRK